MTNGMRASGSSNNPPPKVKTDIMPIISNSIREALSDALPLMKIISEVTWTLHSRQRNFKGVGVQNSFSSSSQYELLEFIYSREVLKVAGLIIIKVSL